MIAVLAVSLGALIGAPARYVIERAMNSRIGPAHFPWALLLINTAGSLLAGIAAATMAGTVRTFVIVGICGAFTTFSGYGWAMHGIRAKPRTYAAALIALPVACCVAFALGYYALS